MANLRLWLDDLEKIEKIVRDQCTEVTMETDEYVVDSVSELRDIERIGQ